MQDRPPDAFREPHAPTGFPGACPVCGVFSEPATACPRCGHAPAVRLPLCLLRRLALALALGGLILLHRAARTREPPLVTASDITPSMNFAFVRADGLMERPVRIHRRDDGEITVLNFSLRTAEGDEAIRAVAFGETARRLAEAGSLPEPGGRLQISGVVDVSSRFGPQIRILAAEHVVPENTRAGAPP